MREYKVHIFTLLLSALMVMPQSGIREFDPLVNVNRLVQIEADYILSCQFMNSSHFANGAINNVYGEPTWVVPRENALAILALIQATTITRSERYQQRANVAADYLVRVQAADGAWFDQYSFMNPAEMTKSPTQTAEVMIALYSLGFNDARYQAMYKGAEFLMACQNPLNKGGNDDGLLGGGKDENGDYYSWRWTSDNSFAYQALKAAARWASAKGDQSFSNQCRIAAERIIEGTNDYLYVDDDQDPDFGVWLRVIDENGDEVLEESQHDWINYAPQMLDLPAQGVGNNIVGDWIHNNLQKSDGACVWDDAEYSQRKSPGYSFQACMCWVDLGQNLYLNSAKTWAINSKLWQTKADTNGIIGGWIDWAEPESQAEQWERFIDTSFYAISAFTGGYNFVTAEDAEK